MHWESGSVFANHLHLRNRTFPIKAWSPENSRLQRSRKDPSTASIKKYISVILFNVYGRLMISIPIKFVISLILTKFCYFSWNLAILMQRAKTASVVKIFSPTFSTQKQAISFCGVASSNNPYNSEQISVQELDVNNI